MQTSQRPQGLNGPEHSQSDPIGKTTGSAEEYLSLAQAARVLPGRPSANCVWRWARKGVISRDGRRVCLRHIRLGGRILTTKGWVDAFGASLAEADRSYFAEQSAGAVPDRNRAYAGPVRGRSRSEVPPKPIGDDGSRNASLIERELEEEGL